MSTVRILNLNLYLFQVLIYEMFLQHKSYRRGRVVVGFMMILHSRQNRKNIFLDQLESLHLKVDQLEEQGLSKFVINARKGHMALGTTTTVFSGEKAVRRYISGL